MSSKLAPSLQSTSPSTQADDAIAAPASTRQRILAEAVALLNDEGFAALTQQHVCERVGIRQSHLTYYFPTRNDLLRETAAFACEAMLDGMLATAKAGEMTLSQIRDVLFVTDESDRRLGRLMTALIVASDEDTRIKPWLASFEMRNRARIAALLRAAGATVSDADIELLHAAYVGAVVLDIGESDTESLARAQRIVHHAFDMLVLKSTAAKALTEATSAKRKPARK
ncbi:MAG: TetR/AcrR family transcriptional regulator [Burkholderiales bacterium]|nr:TetR/AcrR family transcriptional regulator [Burkholderiales bacterium]